MVHRIHVVIVDSFAVVRQCLPWSLSRLAEDIDVVSVTGSGVEAVSVIRDLRPDIVLLGLTLPDLSGLEVAQRVYETQPAVKFIAFTERTDAATLRELRRLGVSGYLTKREGPFRIAQAISGGSSRADLLATEHSAAKRRASRHRPHGATSGSADPARRRAAQC